MFTEDQIETIVNAQLSALLWSECEEYGRQEFFDFYYGHDDATPELRAKLTEELAQLEDVDFYGDSTHDAMLKSLDTYRDHFGDSWPGQFGHDLALTRNGHGAGFWDRGLGDAVDVLTDWAKSLGTLHVFHGSGSIHREKWFDMFHAE